MDAVVQQVAERMPAAVAAKAAAGGPEYEAIAKLSREVIERIAWEVVPELAETIIREQLDRLVAERQKASAGPAFVFLAPAETPRVERTIVSR